MPIGEKMKTLLFVAALLAGCSTSSGVLQAGPNLYTVTTTAAIVAGGAAGAKKSAYEQANAECAKQSKIASIATENATAPSINDGKHTVDIRFSCVAG
jgi:hypothetical protein